MTKQLILIHGRSQEHKDSAALKAEWLEALEAGLAKSGLTLPVPESQVLLPFFGDTLFDLAGGMSPDAAAKVVMRGAADDPEERRFAHAVLEEIRRKSQISDSAVGQLLDRQATQRSAAQEWEWFQGILRAIDRFVPFGSGSAVALFTHDVYVYLKNSAIRQHIEREIGKAFSESSQAIVVAHSLGSVIAYNLLRREGHLRDWQVPLFVTVGSPLAIGEIRKTLKGFAPTRCPECAQRWFNALDERDVVALYPLDTDHFALDPAAPAIENKTDVQNRTRNRHGIAGYLDDQDVARRIHDALIR